MNDAPRAATPAPEGDAPRGAGPAPEGDAPRGAGPVRRLTDADVDGGRRPGRSRPFVENLAVVAAAFVLGTVIAEVAGAANLGTAMSFGQIAFAIALVWVLVRR